MAQKGKSAKAPVAAAVLATLAVVALYTFLLHPGDLRSAAGLSGVEAEKVASVTVTFPWPGSARSEDPECIAETLELLEDTPISRRSYGRLLFPGGGNPYSLSFILADGSKVPILKTLEGRTFSKVYLNLGMNNLGDYDLQKEFVEAYADDIDRIRAIQPDCDIYLMTLFPVTAEQEAKGSYVNNKAIDDLNSCIRYLAAQKGTYLLEVDGLLRDGDGNLPSEDSFDGIHLTPDACKLWRSYLDTHTIQKSATESERSP